MIPSSEEGGRLGTARAAAVDIGTNSVRLLVAEVRGSRESPALKTLQRRMAITRLGEGVDESGELSEEAVERTLEALRRYRELADRESVTVRVAAATSAARDALNAGPFLSAAAGILGTVPAVLGGREEAALSFLGATYDLGPLRPADSPVLVFDIGGGSTEIIAGRDGEILLDRSIDVGCVRMSERFLRSDPPARAELEAMDGYLEGVMFPMAKELERLGAGLVVGLAGTVTTLAGLSMGLEEYDGEAIHHSRLGRGEVEEIFARLVSLTLAERKSLMRLEPGRADVIVGGTAVLRALVRAAGCEEVLVSEMDILDGLALAAALGIPPLGKSPGG